MDCPLLCVWWQQEFAFSECFHSCQCPALLFIASLRSSPLSSCPAVFPTHSYPKTPRHRASWPRSAFPCWFSLLGHRVTTWPWQMGMGTEGLALIAGLHWEQCASVNQGWEYEPIFPNKYLRTCDQTLVPSGYYNASQVLWSLLKVHWTFWLYISLQCRSQMRCKGGILAVFSDQWYTTLPGCFRQLHRPPANLNDSH